MLTSSTARDRVPSKLAGRLWILAAAVLWSSSALFVKAPMFGDWPEGVRGPLLAFWRALFAAMVLLPMIRRPRWRPALVPLTLSFTAMNVLYLSAMTLTTAANAIWLQYTAPWWVLLLSVFIFREPPLRRDLVPLAFGMLGVSTILAFELRGQVQAGVLCGLASGAAFAAVIVLMRHLRAENSAWLVALSQAVAAAVLCPWVMVIGQWPSAGQLAALAAFGALQMAVPYVMLLRGLRAISSQEAVALGLVEPVLLPLWALVWGESPQWWTILGAGLILTGLVLRYGTLERLGIRGELTDVPVPPD